MVGAHQYNYWNWLKMTGKDIVFYQYMHSNLIEIFLGNQFYGPWKCLKSTWIYFDEACKNPENGWICQNNIHRNKWIQIVLFQSNYHHCDLHRSFIQIVAATLTTSGLDYFWLCPIGVFVKSPYLYHWCIMILPVIILNNMYLLPLVWGYKCRKSMHTLCDHNSCNSFYFLVLR